MPEETPEERACLDAGGAFLIVNNSHKCLRKRYVHLLFGVEIFRNPPWSNMKQVADAMAGVDYTYTGG